MNWKRQITAFLAGQTITLFGSMLVQFAITWYIARETSSGLYVTLSVLCSFGPQILLSIFSGVWADRYNKKMLIILSDGGIALATLILAILMARGASGIWLLFIFSAVRSAGSGIQMPAIQAILPQLVPKDKLMRIKKVKEIESFSAIPNLVLDEDSINKLIERNQRRHHGYCLAEAEFIC